MNSTSNVPKSSQVSETSPASLAPLALRFPVVDLNAIEASYRHTTLPWNERDYQRGGQRYLRHEYRNISRNQTASPARSVLSVWKSLRVPVSPISDCADEQETIVCTCPAHVSVNKI